MSVAADALPAALRMVPSLAEAKALAAAHNLIPVCHTFTEDCETPVSAFLKLRELAPGEPAFLLESAEQGQRVGRYSFIGFRPRSVLRWSLADGGDPYAHAAAEVARAVQAPLPGAAPFARFLILGSDSRARRARFRPARAAALSLSTSRARL